MRSVLIIARSLAMLLQTGIREKSFGEGEDDEVGRLTNAAEWWG